MSPPPHPDPLSSTLGTWQVRPSRSPAFRAGVRSRLQATASDAWVAHVRAHLAGWSVAALLAVAGAGWTGHLMAERRLEHAREQMVVAYLGQLDPRVLVARGTKP